MDSDDDYFLDETNIMDEDEDEEEEQCSSICEGAGENKIRKENVIEKGIDHEMSNTEIENYTRQLVDEGYTILTSDEAIKYMNDFIKDVSILTQLPTTTTRILLKHLNWDKDKLLERYYDGDEEKLFSDARIVNPFNEPSANPSTSNVESIDELTTQSIECKICFLQVSDDDMTGLQCGHTFCSSCWISYLKSKIMDEGIVEMISCAAHGCNILADDETIMKLLKDESVKLKYQKLLLNKFIEGNKLLKTCSSPNCECVFKLQFSYGKAVTCKCRNVSCSSCGQSWHDPIECNMLKEWLKKCMEDSETLKWIVTHTKGCPKCHESIEKNGGCNHMCCQKCEYHFCWICMDDWQVHKDSYKCNKYNPDIINVSEETSRIELERYIFYYNRYMNHMQSLKFEHLLYSIIEKKMDELQQHNMSWIEVHFLKSAVDILCQCRQTLMYTYAFAYNLCKNNQSIIFEDNQSDLEKAIELLSEYLEHDFNGDTIISIKYTVQDKYRYLEKRRKVLLDHAHEGHDKGLWLYHGNSSHKK